MRFASSITQARTAEQSLDELLEPIDSHLTPGMVNLVLLFCTAHFEDDLPDVLARLESFFVGAVTLGGTVEGTIGRGAEIERGPSMSLFVASMPDVDVRPFHVRQNHIESAPTVDTWERIVGVSPESDPTFLALADPFRVDVTGFLDILNDVFPGAPVVGGVASAGHAPGQNRLLVNGEIVREGIAGVALGRRLHVDTVVSQGCRPIGRPFVITKGERNVIQELGGHPALAQLHNVLVDLSEEDEQLAKQALFVGRVINERKDYFSRGDFLIQNILGVDRGDGAIGIAGHARVGATVQFHVRDAVSADEDLRLLLSKHAAVEPDAALLFGCNGRGTNMWPTAGHDVGVLHELMGDIPVAGCFCGGEFGPVGGNNFIHGFTASIALLRDPEGDSTDG